MQPNESLKDIAKLFTNNMFASKNLVLLGTSQKGVVNSPVKITDISYFEKLFGTEGTLYEAYKQLMYLEQDVNIICVKATGKHSELYLNAFKDDILENILLITAIEAGDVYNNIVVSISETSISFEFPDELSLDDREYLFSDYVHIPELINAINTDTITGKSCVNIIETDNINGVLSESLYYDNLSVQPLHSGNTGLIINKNQYYDFLVATYDLLEGQDIDVVVPLGAFIDDSPEESPTYGDSFYPEHYHETKDTLSIKLTNGEYATFYRQLVKFLAGQMRYGYITHGVMSFDRMPVKEFETPVREKEFAKYKAETLNGIFVDDLLAPYTRLVSVTIGDLEYNYRGGVSTGAVLYGYNILHNSVSENITNKPFHPSISLYNELSKEVINYLSFNGIVSFRHSPLYNTVVTANGVTSNRDKSCDYCNQLCNVRMIELTCSMFSRTFKRLVGNPMHILADNRILDENIRIIISFLQEKDVVTSVKYDIIRNKDSFDLAIDFIPKFMTEFVSHHDRITYKGGNTIA